MSRAIKRIALIAVSLIMAACLTLGLVACAKSYSITIEESQHGTVTSDVSQAKEGDEVTLTVTPDKDYHLDVLLVNDKPQTVNGTTAKFTMPAEDVTVKATFEKDQEPVIIPDNAAKETLPQANSIELTANAAGVVATSHWSIVYGANGLEITVYVEDSKVIDGKDGVGFYVGRKGFAYTSLSEINYGVNVYINGAVEQYAVSEGAYAKTTDGAFTASAVLWTNGSTTAIAGYKVTMSVSYDDIGTEAKGEITVLPVLHNCNTTSSALPATTATYGKNDIDNPGSYMILADDNTLEESDYAGGMGQLGSTSTIEKGSYWDLSKDYAEEDTENYPNREAVLSGGSDADNDLVFFRTEGEHVYAKATFKVTDVYNNEKWGKFGLMLFDGATKKGIFFYADAIIGDGKDITVDNISGTSVGYNIAAGSFRNEDYKPISETDGSFNLTTKTITMAMTYSNGYVSMYVGDRLVNQVHYVPQGDVAIGIKSFNYALVVTDYVSLDDPEDPEFVAHNPQRDHGTVMGDYTGNPSRDYTDGWNVNPDNGNDAESMNGLNEQSIYYRDLDYSADLYFETMLKSTANTGADQWPKVGLILTNDKMTVLAYFDLGGGNSNNGAVNMVYRPTGGGWDWDHQAGAKNTGANVITGYVKVAIAKLGSTLYMLVDDKVVVTWDNCPDVTENTLFIAGVMGFNRKMEVKDATATNVAEDIEYILKATHTITATTYDGVTIDVDKTTAKEGDTVTFTIDAGTQEMTAVHVTYGDGQEVEVVKGDDGKYTFVMPDADVTISIEFANRLSVTISSDISDKLTASTYAPVAGDTVTFEATENWVIVKLYYNDGEGEPKEITPDEGVYKLVVNANVTITGEFLFTAGGVVLDGELDAKYGTTYTVAEYDDDRTITLHAVKTDAGVWIYVVARMNTMKDDEPVNNWFLNTNFEFQINADGQRYVNIAGHTQNITKHIWKTDREGGKYVYTVEIYIENAILPNANGDLQLNYAWKTGGERAYVIGDHLHRDKHNSGDLSDWLAFHGVGGINGDFKTTLDGGNAMPNNLHISENGIVIGQAPQEEITIDGDLDEFSDYRSYTVGDRNRSSVTFTGFAGKDGLYLAMTITHKGWSTLQGNWWENDNIELIINDAHDAIIWINGKLTVPSFISQVASKTTEQDGKKVTTVEMFIASSAKFYSLKMGITGGGFDGWQALIWDNRVVYVTADGVTDIHPDKIAELATAGIVLDGKFDEAVWTAKDDSDVMVKDKKFTDTANGATITVIGVTTSKGILMGVTIVHSKPITDPVQNVGDAWWHMINVEFRFGNNPRQIGASVYGGQHSVNECVSDYSTVANDDGTYTTTLEILAEYPDGYTASSNVEMAMAVVVGNGFARLFGSDWNDGEVLVNSHLITSNGMEVIQ